MLTIALVYGGREYNNPVAVRTAITVLSPDIIVSGMAPGADTIAANVALNSNITLQRFEPDWEHYGKSAGFRRNEQMVNHLITERNAGHTVCAIVFPGGNGTAHTTHLCQRNNIIVLDGEQLAKEAP